MIQSSSSSQIINFCLEPFVANVATSSIAADGFSPGNLTSTKSQIRAKGFRVEHFMRPPIHVDLEFNVPISIACIIVSQQLEAGTEVRLEVSGSFQSSPDYQYKLCSGVVVSGEQSVLVLKNRAFRERDWETHGMEEAAKSVLGSFMNFSLVEVHIMEQPLKHPNILTKLRQLRLTVSRMSGPRPVAVRTLEVWGVLSKVSNKEHKELFQTALSGSLCASPPTKFRVFGVSGGESCPEGNNKQGSKETLFANSCVCGETVVQYPGPSRQRGFLSEGGRKAEYELNSDLIPNKLTMGNQQEARIGGGHFIGCSNEVNSPAVKPHSSVLLGKERIIVRDAATFPPSNPLSNPDATLRHHDLCMSSDRSSNLYSDPSNSNQDDHKQALTPVSMQADLELPCTTITSTSSLSRSTDSVEHDHVLTKDVPPQFLDEITCDVMLIPMLLPSGHYVDRSTVDRLARHDAIYGRPPLDPFTGIAFTESIKPEFCPKLKLQLDDYRSQSENETSGRDQRGQTLGSAEEIASHLRRIQDCRRDLKRTRSDSFTADSRPARKKATFHHPQYNAKRDTNTQLYRPRPAPQDMFVDGASASIRDEKHPAIFPTTSHGTTSRPMPAHSGYFPTSLDGSTPVQVTTSKPPTWKRMCDQAETNLRASGKTRPPSGDAVSSFENEVSCSLDRALEKLLSS